MKLNRIMGFTPSKEYEPIPTGFRELDEMVGGLPVGQVSIVGARPGLGKTSFAVSLMRNIGVLQKVPAALLSMQHTEQDVLKRLYGAMMGFYKQANQFPQSLTAMKDIPQEMKEAPVWIEHANGMTMHEVVSRMERLSQENKVRVFFIDSLQWMTAPENYVDQSNAMLLLHQTAQKLKAAVVLITTLNRSVELRGGSKRPMLVDLPDRDFKNMENIASLVMFIYRPEYYLYDVFEDGSTCLGMADVMVCKNVNGPVDNIRVRFDYNEACFTDVKPNTKPLDEDELPF